MIQYLIVSFFLHRGENETCHAIICWRVFSIGFYFRFRLKFSFYLDLLVFKKYRFRSMKMGLAFSSFAIRNLSRNCFSEIKDDDRISVTSHICIYNYFTPSLGVLVLLFGLWMKRSNKKTEPHLPSSPPYLS